MKWSAAQALSWVIRKAPLAISEWTPDMGPELEPAEQKLAKAIAAGGVGAWGRKAQKPHDSVELIPSDLFRIAGVPVVVRPHGDMGSLLPHKLYLGPCWYEIEFDADEVKRAFPTPPPPTAQHWMLEEAQRLRAEGQIGKRDDMIARCRQATGCTKREAEAAHKALPEGLRRPRGKPPKSRG